MSVKGDIIVKTDVKQADSTICHGRRNHDDGWPMGGGLDYFEWNSKWGVLNYTKLLSGIAIYDGEAEKDE